MRKRAILMDEERRGKLYSSTIGFIVNYYVHLQIKKYLIA